MRKLMAASVLVIALVVAGLGQRAGEGNPIEMLAELESPPLKPAAVVAGVVLH